MARRRRPPDCRDTTYDLLSRQHPVALSSNDSGDDHHELTISPEEFDEVAAELGRRLDFVKVPTREMKEVLAAFARIRAR